MSGAPARLTYARVGRLETPGVYIPFTVGAHGLAFFMGGACAAHGFKRIVRGFLQSRAPGFSKVSITLENLCVMCNLGSNTDKHCIFSCVIVV